MNLHDETRNPVTLRVTGKQRPVSLVLLFTTKALIMRLSILAILLTTS